ncbi:MAG: hypothetical protein WBF06_09940 [Candidatus Acidiferrales bacterium]
MKRAALLAAMAFAITSGGCHKSTAAATPTITISPTSLTMEAGTSTQFGDTITNETTSAVTWLVNGIVGGNATTGIGTISTTGLYQAPATLTPAGGEDVYISVELTADTTLFASAPVDITPIPVVSISPATLSPLAPSIPAAPTELSVSLFGLQNCENPDVTWEVGSVAGGNATLGTIVQTSAPVLMCIANGGTYTAMGTANYFPPQVPPPGGSVFVSAYLDADTTQAAGVTATLNYAAASAQGSYAFSLAGQNANGFFARAGQFTPDGISAISGTEDVHFAGSPATTSAISGNYAIGPDGRGTATLTDSTGTTNYDLVVVNANQIKLIEADNFATARGEADLQTPSSFTQASFLGGYAFDFFGVSGAALPTSEVGQFRATGTGAMLQTGLEDINASGTLTPAAAFSGNFGAINSATGRGTATINGFSGPTTFTFYMISTGQVRFIETDTSADLVGDALQQSGGTANDGFLSSLNVFTIAGRSTTGKIATAGIFLADGGGNFCTSLPTSSCLLDENNNGTVMPSAQFTGNYSVAASGRGTASITPSGEPAMTFVIYFVSPGQGFIQETDSSTVADGQVVAQRGGIFSTLNVTGSFALNWTGATPPTTAQQDATGQLTVGTTAGVVSGTWDRNDALILQPGIVLTGGYSLAVNGRGSVTLMDPSSNTYHLAAYVANSNTVFLVGTDPTLALTGQLTRQF